MNKQTILENVAEYSAEQLVDYIRQGEVTFEELRTETEGEFQPKVRQQVQSLLAEFDQKDWENALQANTVEAYDYYLKMNANGLHRDEAEMRKQNVPTAAPPVVEQPRVIQPEPPVATNDPWALVNKNSIEDLQSFIDENPTSPHIYEARKLINELYVTGGGRKLTWKEIVRQIKAITTDKTRFDPEGDIINFIVDVLSKNRFDREEFLFNWSKDTNLLRASTVKTLCDEGYFTISDFQKMGIWENYIYAMLDGMQPVNFSQPELLRQINKKSTEIYFWGIPSSGKSCALGAILSVANNGRVAQTMEIDEACQGYDYLNRLPRQFHSDGEVCVLPGGTPTIATYEMGFDLIDNEGRYHPITCIDLAGELIEIMYKVNANDPNNEPTDEQLTVLDAITQVLVDNHNDNRKIHFFVLEYGAEDRLYNGLPQSAYLNGALSYIKRTSIFNKQTDAIYLMISKADKARQQGRPMGEVLRDYIAQNYLSFYNGLRTICHRHEINGGNIPVLPFSLGEVCFQDYCRFNEVAATNVVNEILKRSKSFSEGKISKFANTFKK